jgi:hypothetical protein
VRSCLFFPLPTSAEPPRLASASVTESTLWDFGQVATLR